MTSKLKVNILADGGDNAIMTSDGSGSLTINNAALKNTPVLSVGLTSTQNMSDNTWTTIVMDSEILDADGIYNNSTGVATPTAGTYFMVFTATIGGTNSNTINDAGLKFLIGSTTYAEQVSNPNQSGQYENMSTSYLHTFDGSTTVACQGYVNVSSGTANVYGGGSNRFGATFQMIRLIGA